MMRHEKYPLFLLSTPSLPWCHLKTTNNSAKFHTLFFRFSASAACERIITKTQNIKSRCYGAGKYTVQERPCIFQPGHVIQAGAVKGLNINI